MVGLHRPARPLGRHGTKVKWQEYAEQLVTLAELAGCRELLRWGYLMRGLASGDEDEVYRALGIGRDLGCLVLQWEAGKALAHLAGDENSLALAQEVVRTIADCLAEELQATFLARERVQDLLNEKAHQHC